LFNFQKAKKKNERPKRIVAIVVDGSR